MRKFLLMIASILGFAGQQANANQFVLYQDIKPILQKLKNSQLEYNFFGLTSNGIDCLYFAFESGKFLLEYEVMVEPQKEVANSFKSWAKKAGFSVITTTYDNQPKYSSTKPAPVYRVVLSSNLGEAYEQGLSFYTNVFGYDQSKPFEVVP
ncbi:conserved exported hypothetical protein [Vibrio crassostreae]|nr:conserved exported hypothetical protein [Vibrio crassostreae]